MEWLAASANIILAAIQIVLIAIGLFYAVQIATAAKPKPCGHHLPWLFLTSAGLLEYIFQ